MTRRIRVVFCLDSLGVGGTEMNAVKVAERLDRNRFDLSVACFRGDGALRPRFDAAGIPVRVFPVRSLYGASAVREGWAFARFLRREHVDVVHAHDRYANVFAAPWARLAGTPALITSKRWNSISRVHSAGNRLAFALSHRVLGNSSRVGQSLVETEGVPQRRVVVIPNFVDDDAFLRPSDVWLAERRAQLDLAAGTPVVGIVANLRAIKDHATLLRAIARVREEIPSVVLVLMGSGDQLGPLQALAAELGIAGAVRFGGAWPNLPNPHFLFDVSVLSSLSEGFPNTLVEAMAAGRPVVSTLVGGVPDAVEDGVNGRLVPARDAEAMSAVLKVLLRDAETRRSMGAEGLSIARSRFAAASVMPLVERLYEDLLQGK